LIVSQRPDLPRIALRWSLGGDGDLRAVALIWWSSGRRMVRSVSRSAAGLAATNAGSGQADAFSLGHCSDDDRNGRGQHGLRS
jgi:hypothetical protein